jgi:hypothetical protein
MAHFRALFATVSLKIVKKSPARRISGLDLAGALIGSSARSQELELWLEAER